MSQVPNFFQRLRERKVVQYGLAYLAAGWLLLQVASVVGDHFGWSSGTLRAITVVLAAGFPLTLVLSWYHGEKGRQRVSGPELLMVTALLVMAGVALTLVRDGSTEGQAVAGSAAERDLAESAVMEETSGSGSVAPGSRRAGDVADVASIAVLPFDNLTGDPEQEYFSDGMTEEIITRLARLEGLKVISRTSAMRYRDVDKTLREIGRELGVTNVLEGSVRREGRQVKVTAQLIDARTDAHLWAETYDRELESIFEIQADVARAIAGELELRFSGDLDPGTAAARRYGTDDLEALDLYLRARKRWSQRTEASILEAIRLFEQAVERDPEFAAAHAGLADALIVLPAYAYSEEDLDHRALYERAMGAAERALELDPGLAEAHAALGMAATYTYRWETAGEHFRRAIQGAPGYATAHQWYALHLSAIGRLDDAIRHAERARLLDPYAVAVTFDLGLVNFLAGRYESALRMVDQARALSPEYTADLDLRVAILERLGRYGEAIDALELFLRQAFGQEVARSVVPGVRAAYREDGPEGYHRAMARATAEDAPHFLHALYVARAGDLDRAFQLLDQAVSRNEFQMIHLGMASGSLEGLRSDPRYWELMERMGLDEYFERSGGRP